MSRSHVRLAAVWAALVPIALAVSLTTAVTAQQKPPQQPKQQYLDKWVNVPFCGSVTITRNGSAKATIQGAKWEKSDFGQLTANVTGAKDKVNQRTGRVFGFFVEGTVNMTYSYNETSEYSGETSTWNMQANGQKQHTYSPGAYTWTELHVNKAQGLYRFRPPGGTARGTMTYKITRGETHQQPASFDEWHAPVGDEDRRFDPKTGVITDSANFTCWNLIGIKDFFGREAIFCDPPQLRPSEQELPSLQRARDAIAKVPQLFKNADPERLRPVNFAVTWNLNLDTGACQRTVRIKDPRENHEVVFGGQYKEPNNLVFNCIAEATPKSYEPNIYPWDADDIDGSTKALISLGLDCQRELNDTPVKGPCVRFRFTNLPKDNAQFGKKTITADTAAPLHVRVFFKKFDKTNPEGNDANWYYYWKQGAVPGLERFEYGGSSADSAAFDAPDTFTIYDQAALCQDALDLELFERLPGFVNPGSREDAIGIDEMDSMKKDMTIRPFRTIHIDELSGVDKCHASVLHELKHKWVYDSFKGLFDQDGDCLPDAWEILTQPVYQFDPTDPDTHFMRYQLSEGYYWYGDEELLCREAELGHAAVHELDWATPGKQSENKDECNEHP